MQKFHNCTCFFFRLIQYALPSALLFFTSLDELGAGGRQATGDSAGPCSELAGDGSPKCCKWPAEVPSGPKSPVACRPTAPSSSSEVKNKRTKGMGYLILENMCNYKTFALSYAKFIGICCRHGARRLGHCEARGVRVRDQVRPEHR